MAASLHTNSVLFLPPAKLGEGNAFIFLHLFVEGVKRGAVLEDVWWRGCGRHPPLDTEEDPLDPEADPPVEKATEASATHPTGMHSCS